MEAIMKTITKTITVTSSTAGQVIAPHISPTDIGVITVTHPNVTVKPGAGHNNINVSGTGAIVHTGSTGGDNITVTAGHASIVGTSSGNHITVSGPGNTLTLSGVHNKVVLTPGSSTTLGGNGTNIVRADGTSGTNNIDLTTSHSTVVVGNVTTTLHNTVINHFVDGQDALAFSTSKGSGALTTTNLQNFLTHNLISDGHGNTILELGHNQNVTLIGVQPSALHAADFTFI